MKHFHVCLTKDTSETLLLKLDTNFYHARKRILAGHSESFREMFTKILFKEAEEDLLDHTSSFSVSVIKKFLKILYNEQYRVDDDYFQVAKKLQMPRYFQGVK